MTSAGTPLHPVGAGRDAAAGLEGHHDRGVPAGEALHGSEAGGRVVSVHEIDGDPRRTAVLLPNPDRAHHADVADRGSGDLRLEQAVVDPSGHDGLPVHIDGLLGEEAEALVGLEGREVAGVAEDLVLVALEAAEVRVRRRGHAQNDERLEPRGGKSTVSSC
jgi:hypothetical protein